MQKRHNSIATEVTHWSYISFALSHQNVFCEASSCLMHLLIYVLHCASSYQWVKHIERKRDMTVVH